MLKKTRKKYFSKIYCLLFVKGNIIVSNCALVWHYQVTKLYNGVYCIMVFVMHLSLIIRALSNCQNFNLGQANLPLMIQIGIENTKNEEIFTKIMN